MTLTDFLTDRQMGPAVHSLLRNAKAVQIYPAVLKAAFFFGASGGSGVTLARDSENHWRGPAFCTMGSVSFGAQAGGESMQVLLVALTNRGLAALQSTSARLGADAEVAIGPMGLGAAAATQNLSADIVSYIRAKGLYGGVSVEGAVVATRTALNQAFYGQAATPMDILVRGEATTDPVARELVDTLQHAETVASGTGTAPAKAVASGTETAPAKAVAHGTETAPAKAVAHGTETHGTETASATAGATAPERLTLHINFDKDKATIRQEDAAELQKVIDFAKQHPGGRITIEGYTDSTGSPEYNQSLSERRAAAAKDYLAKNGAPGNEQITIVGYGESKPIASNSTAEGRAENRRVDIAALQ